LSQCSPILLVLGNQLFPPSRVAEQSAQTVFMAEDPGLCTYVRHHQQKIVLFLAAMRSYADELRDAGLEVIYHRLDPDSGLSYEDRLGQAVDESGAEEILHFEIEDKAMETRIMDFARDRGLKRSEIASPMFLCGRDEFAAFAESGSRLLMAEFYKAQRKRLSILIDEAGGPEGGQWSFDAENRKKLPRKIVPPEVTAAGRDPHVDDVIELVEAHFGDHPGKAAEFWWPTTRKQARAWLDEFVEQRLAGFGPYEDALTTRSETLFHSLLSPMLNMGLLTPDEVLDRVLDHADGHDVPLNSLEGFVRQVIGWREFIRGVYRQHSEEQDEANFFSHARELTDHWYDGTTGIPPLDDAIGAAQRLGWTHHIPRLMVLGNLMTLCEIRPRSAHRWFMEMFVDSSEWVMGPNVYGMGLFSDGGIFATKPYICGSNYLRKMSDYPGGEWCDVVDGLYWRFIHRHREFFASNPRLALMPKALDRLKKERREKIFDLAGDFLERFTAA
jgi:deoxyribodipyrimidine photolyase-related protein